MEVDFSKILTGLLSASIIFLFTSIGSMQTDITNLKKDTVYIRDIIGKDITAIKETLGVREGAIIQMQEIVRKYQEWQFKHELKGHEE